MKPELPQRISRLRPKRLTNRSSRDRFAARLTRYRVPLRQAAARSGLTQVLEHTVKFFRRSILYIQVYPDHFQARVLGEDKRVRRDCHSLDNRRAEIHDFSKIRKTLKSLITDLTPGFSLRKPTALMHFIPAHYMPTQHELEKFKQAAEKAGISFCFLSKWETPHTDRELNDVFSVL